MRKYIYTLGALFLCLQLFCSMNRVQAQCADGLGQIAFTGYQIADNSNPQGQEDQFSFILLDSLQANTKIYFTDLGLVNVNVFQTTTQAKTDGVLIWSNPSGLSPGTHIVIKVLSQTANFGLVTKGDGNFELGLGGDQLFACMGSLTPAAIEAALLINKANWDSAMEPLTSSKSVKPNLDPTKKMLAVVSSDEDAFQARWPLNVILQGDRAALRQQAFSQSFTKFDALDADKVQLNKLAIDWQVDLPSYTPITYNESLNTLSITSNACYIRWQSSTDNNTYNDLPGMQGTSLQIPQVTSGMIWYRAVLIGGQRVYSEPYYIGPLSDAPIISNLNGDSQTYTEGALSVFLDVGSNATVSDEDSPDFEGGSLRIAIIDNPAPAEDKLAIHSQGLLVFADGEVSYDGQSFGTVAGGVGGQDLFINFNNHAKVENVQALIRRLTYMNLGGNDPTAGARSISVVLSDGEGGISTAAVVTVNVITINDAPTLVTVATNATFTEKGSPVAIFSGTQASTIEKEQKIISLAMEIAGVKDYDTELLTIAGSTHVFNKGSWTLASPDGFEINKSYDPNRDIHILSVSSTAGLTPAEVNSLIDGLRYHSTSNDPSPGKRTFTIKGIQDNGGKQNAGIDQTTLTIASTITLEAVNDAPTLMMPAMYIFNQGEELPLTGISFQDVDARDGLLTVTLSVEKGTFFISTAVAGITVTDNNTNKISLTGTLADLNKFISQEKLVYKSDPKFYGESHMDVYINDQGNTGSGGPKSDNIRTIFMFNKVNTHPVARPDSYEVEQGAELKVAAPGILANDEDVNGDVLTALLVTGTGQGTLTLNSNGSFTYMPNPDFEGTDTFTYKAYDGEAYSQTVTVTISVLPSNPRVVNIRANSSDGLYKIGDKISLRVVFSSAVKVNTNSGIPRLALATGASQPRYASYVYGSGQSSLVFEYTVQAGDQTTKLDSKSSTALELNGASLVSESDGMIAILTVPVPGTINSISGVSSLSLDGIAPAFEISLNNGVRYTNYHTIMVSLSSTDTDLSNMRFSENGTVWRLETPYEASQQWVISGPDGPKKVYVEVFDHAGNSAVKEAEIILDMTVPIVSGVSNDGIYNTDLTITFNEGTATLNGAAFTSGTKVSAEGDYTLVVTDAASNVTNVAFKIDKTAPVVHGVYNEGIFYTDPIISFNEGTALLNGNPFTSGTRVSKEDNYTLVVTDEAGNVTTVSFVIDKTAPGKPTGLQGLAGNKQVELSWSENTELDFEYYAISYSSSTIPKTFWKNVSTASPNPIKDMLDNGVDYTFYVKAIDKAGNASAEATITATPKDAQTISFAAPTGLRYGMADLSLLATASSGLAVTYKSSDIGIALPYQDLADAGKWKLKILNAGHFVLTAMQVGSNTYSEALEVSHRLEIAKADLSSISLANQTYTYDGTSKELLVSGILPTGVTVAYTGNKQTNAGVYAVEANLDGGLNYENKSLQASLTIAKAAIVGISLANQSYTYDGTSKELLVAGTLPTGVTVAYTGNKQTNAGVYPIEANLIGGTNYENKSLQASLTIAKAAITGISLANKSYTYDGTSKELLVSGTLPTGVTVTYTGNKQTNAGVYAVVASLDGGSNYEGQTLNANLTIAKAILNHLRLNDAQFVYDAQVKSLQIMGALPAGLVIRYSNNEQINAGIYTVTAEVKPTQNYDGLNLSARLEILKATQQIDFPAVSDLYRDAGTVDLKVQASSGLPVQLVVDEPLIAQLSGLSLSVLRLGTVVVTATQAGDSNYEAATAVAQRIRIVADAGAALPIRVHQALSPNGDGINDFFMIEGILDYPENKVTIFDKAGRVIQVIESYNNRDRVFTGEYILDGTYYYYIDVKDGNQWKREKGFFVIKRASNN